MNNIDPEFMFKYRFWQRVGIAMLLLTVLLLAGCPPYNVWKRKLEGEGELAHAEQVRQIQVAQAQGELDAARKTAEAIEILGKKAKEFPEYRMQQFIGAYSEALTHGSISQIIYVPTEGGIPIMEAGKIPRAAQEVNQ